MEFIQENNIINAELPFEITETKNNPHLKYLLNLLYRKTLSADEVFLTAKNIHFILAEERKIQGYVPFFILLCNRLNDFEEKFNCTPRDFHKTWETELHIDGNKNNFLIIKKENEVRKQDFDSLILSLLPKYGKNEAIPFKDTKSLIFFTNSANQENDLLNHCRINNFFGKDLFKTCKVDFNAAWDGISSLITSRLSCLCEYDLFQPIHQSIPIHDIVITYEALESYTKDIIPPDDHEDPLKYKIETFCKDLTDFSNVFNVSNIVITSPAKNCLLIESLIHKIQKFEKLQTEFVISQKCMILESDFKNNYQPAPLIESHLKYQFKNNTFLNCINELERRINGFQDPNYASSEFLTLKTEFHKLKKNSLALIVRNTQPLLDRLSNCTKALNIEENEKQTFLSKLDVLKNTLHYFDHEFALLINEIKGDNISIFSDNYVDYDIPNQNLYQINNIRVRVHQIDWNNLILPQAGNTFVFSINISDSFIQSKIYDFFFMLATRSINSNGRIYLLMSKRDLLASQKIINAFERSIKYFHNTEYFTYQTSLLNEVELNRQISYANDSIVENIDDYIQNSLIYVWKRNIGVKREFSDNHQETVDLYLMNEYNNNQIIINYDIPAGRLYNLVDEHEGIRKRADELLPGEKILVIFDERDNTYDSIRDLLRERNTNQFNEKYIRSKIWTTVLKTYKETNGIESLARNINFPTHRIRYWLNWIHVMPDDFEKLIDSIKELIRNNTNLYPENNLHQIGETESYIRMYNEVYNTPRRIYQQIIQRIRKNTEIDYSIIQYEEIFDELRNRSKILKVINSE